MKEAVRNGGEGRPSTLPAVLAQLDVRILFPYTEIARSAWTRGGGSDGILLERR
jgi:hypothetical protein